MRTLVLLRGAPGCGKSTWIKQNKLEPYTVSADEIRLLFQSPTMKPNGDLSIGQKADGKVWNLIFQILEERMQRGEFTIIDATHSRTSLISRYKNLIKKYKYRCYVVDFSDVPLDIIKERNNNRENYKFVPEEIIENAVARIKTQPAQGFITVIKPEDFWKTFLGLREPVDLSKYNKIVIFGDIHGCYNPLKEYFENNSFDDNNFYVFLGDYIDRGLESVEVLKFIMNISDKENVVLLEGNHEIQLYNYANNEPITSNNFIKTREELIQSSITTDDLSKFYRKLCQLFYFTFNGDIYLCTHGGLPRAPSQFTSTYEIIHGSGEYEDIDEVYKSWNENTKGNNFFQISGHRNIHDFPIDEYFNDGCFNLCDHIEYGGNLRILEIMKKYKDFQNEDGYEEQDLITKFNPIYIKNNIFEERKSYKPKVTIKDVNNITALRTNSNVVEKDLGDGISSFNFNHNAFRKGIWDAETVKARGLFVDVVNNKVVARSYDKFFNLGQNPGANLYDIKTQWKFPLKSYVKYNGFLGIISWDNAKNDWMICSKSLNSGEYVDIIKTTIDECWSDEIKNKIKDWLKNHDYSLVFEVINPKFDVHIIKYDESHMVLLDCIKNDWKFEKYSISDLYALKNAFGIEVKQIYLAFETFDELNYALNQINSGHWDIKDEFKMPFIEGIILEDKDGRMSKIKFPYYNLWKYMREILKSLQKGHIVNLAKLTTPEENYIVAFMKSLGEKIKEIPDIITLRGMYEESNNNRKAIK